MNEFEKLAQRLKLPHPPAEWRDEIIRACESQADEPVTFQSGSVSARGPGRMAWLALAAVWLILALLANTRRLAPPSHVTPMARAESFRNLDEHRDLIGLLTQR